ncbi:MAG: NPCBM/NEW2 domain-containing protein, partial [Planctomycetota bacterium]
MRRFLNLQCGQRALVVLAVTAWCAGSAETGGRDACGKKGAWAESMVAAREHYLQSPEGKNQAPVSGVFKPYDSGTIRGDGPAQQVSLSVAGVKLLRLEASCEQGTANCNIWGEPRLIAKDGSETRLTSLKPLSTIVGWGEYLVDKNWQGHQLQIGERKFQYGIWVHANSEVQFALDGKYERFEAYVGEDKDRANGALRFKVLSGETPQPPAFWGGLARDFPAEAGRFSSDAGTDGVIAWFSPRDNAALEQDVIGRLLGQLGEGGRGMKAELEALVQAKSPAGDIRWLELYGRACRYRECAELCRHIGTGEAKTALEKELADLAAAKAGPNDPRWADFIGRAVQGEEIERQYKVLEFDLKQRAVINKYSQETFRPEALILASDRDPVDVLVRRSAALLSDLLKTAAAPKLAACAEQLAKLQKAAAETPPLTLPSPPGGEGGVRGEARRALFAEACKLRRQIAFANPLLNFDQLLFIKRHRAAYDHMCDQFYGMANVPGGGLYVLSNPFGPNPQERDLLANSVVEEGLLLGVAGSAVGLFAGIGLAPALDGLFKAFGADLPDNGTVLETRTVIVSLGVGIVITMLAGFFPALRATRVPPMAAMREGVQIPPRELTESVVLRRAGLLAVVFV